MKNYLIRFLSALLVVLMIAGCVNFSVFADGEDDTDALLTDVEEPADDAADDTAEPADDTAGPDDDTAKEPADGGSDTSDGTADSGDDKDNTTDVTDKSSFYENTVYSTQEEKLYTMTLKQRAYGYELYTDDYTGEVACRRIATGEVLFTNPFDLASSESSSAIKKQLLSQIMLSYSDSTGAVEEMNSFKDAAVKGQIKVKNLRNGVRVEYSMGEEEVRYLVPRLIRADRYEELIKALIDESGSSAARRKFEAYYMLQDPDDPTLSVRQVKEMQAKYPITEKMAVYVFDKNASARELKLIEKYIKLYCPDYSYATLDEDHQITGYSATQKPPPLFKMALEYYLDEDGLQIRLPANGIRFDEDEYQLLSIRILPFFGAGANPNTGYTFLPDGSGSLFCFEDLAGMPTYVTGKVYGSDFAYHELGTINQEIMRLPVYGVVEHYDGNRAELYRYWTDGYVDEDGNPVPEGWYIGADYTPIQEDRGYFAIIEEGDSLATITTSHGGSQHKYNSVYTEFYPRPSDSYRLDSAISVADSSVWTITSKRKYAGSYKLRIVMLTDEQRAKDAGLAEDDYYECSYVGMAKASRDYLVRTGVLKPIEDTGSDIPLYIESFGATERDTTVLSIPTKEKAALTTFEDIRTMYDELAEKGVTNVNFRLTGFANGGMESVLPDEVDFEKVVGGEDGYRKLIEYSDEKGFGVFPEFNFSYALKNETFDGFKLKRDAVRTIDNRYTTRREYDSSYQEIRTTGEIAVSPSVFANFYAKVKADLDKYGTKNISVSTLGSSLNSDFDKNEPYNREDCKGMISNLLEEIGGDYDEVMVDSGNAYTWKYADHILNVSLDSSHFNAASYTVPFMGMVLHGYVNFTGTPTNMSSDMNYMTLKMLENGALPYFTLSYQNTPLLKENNKLARYYSVSYEIWRDDLVETYNKLNGLLKNVQSATIEDHQFLDGQRVPDEDEYEADKAAAEAEAAAKAAQAAALEEKLEKARKLAARKGGEATEEPDETDEDTAQVTDIAADGVQNAEDTEEPAPAEDDLLSSDKYAVTDGSIVRVTYSNGVSYILNYNRFTVTVEGFTIEPLGFVKVSG